MLENDQLYCSNNNSALHLIEHWLFSYDSTLFTYSWCHTSSHRIKYQYFSICHIINQCPMNVFSPSQLLPFSINKRIKWGMYTSRRNISWWRRGGLRGSWMYVQIVGMHKEKLNLEIEILCVYAFVLYAKSITQGPWSWWITCLLLLTSSVFSLPLDVINLHNLENLDFKVIKYQWLQSCIIHPDLNITSEPCCTNWVNIDC